MEFYAHVVCTAQAQRRAVCNGTLQKTVHPLVFGLFVLIAPQSYIGLLNYSGYSGSDIEWYPDFFHLHAADEGGYFLGGHTCG
jgi:hypothetical protein